jgi:hypothetical protein
MLRKSPMDHMAGKSLTAAEQFYTLAGESSSP